MNYLEVWILILNFLLVVIFIMYYKLMRKYFKLLDLHKEITNRLHGILKMKDGKYDMEQFDYNCGVLDSIQEVLNAYLDFMGMINKEDDKNEKNR